MESFAEILEQPIVPFAILLVVILTVPMIFERLRLPGLVGLLAAGVLLGPNGLQVLHRESETVRLLSDIGLVYLMFVAGLEVDLEQFRKTKYRSIGFGSLTFIIPLIVGTIVGRVFGFSWNTSILIGSLFASHTLLAYPIVSRLGVVGNEAVTVTIGATIFTDVGALLVLAVCVGIHGGDFNLTRLIILLGSLALYSAAVLFGFDWLGKEFFRRSGDEQGNQFLFVLLAVFLAALGAQLIGVEKIVGAFLAGLAVNDAVGEGPVKEKVVFVGSVLFIPIFFVDMGLLINIPAFIKTLSSFWLTAAIVVGLIGSKFLAALGAKLLYRYNWQEMLAMWSLSMPQVAATLAAALVGYRTVNSLNQRLLSEEVLNSVLVLMLVTAILGPVITSRVARGLTVNPAMEPTDHPLPEGIETSVNPHRPFRVIVPVSNPQTEGYLIEMAAILAHHLSGQVMPLAIASAHANLEHPQLEQSLQHSDRLLERATALSREFKVKAEPLLRIDDNIGQGISRAAREANASLIVMGWGNRTGLRARLFGNVIDNVLWAAHCPVAVTRLLASPRQMRRILVPVENLTPQALRPVQFAHLLAQENEGVVTVLHVCEPRMTAARIAFTRSQLALVLDKLVPNAELDLNIMPSDHISQAILTASQSVDLVVMRSVRHRTTAGLEMSDQTTQVLAQITSSLVLLGEPQRLSQGSLFYQREVQTPSNL